MILPLELRLEDVGKLSERATDVYYNVGETFTTTRDLILKNCVLTPNQKDTVMNFPETGIVKLKNVELGTFNIVI